MASFDECYINQNEDTLSEEQQSFEEQTKSEESISLTEFTPVKNEEGLSHKKSAFVPNDDVTCLSCIKQSNSSLYVHLRYPYPAVEDPGIKEALFGTEPSVRYPNDGQALYLQLCAEMNTCPVRSFHRNLLNPKIDLGYYGVDPRGVRPMALALKFNYFVTHLDLTDNFLNDDSCYHLGQMLKHNDTLKELILTGCRIGSSGLLHLGQNLHFNCSLESLILDRNNIGDAGGVIFSNLVSIAYFKEVNLSNNGMGEETAAALAEGLECRNPLTHLDLSWNDFSHITSTARMLKQLANSELLQELNLSFTSLEGDVVGGAIAIILNMPELRVLDLSHNLLQGEAIHLIAIEIINAKKLKTLHLSYNPMSPRDAYTVLQKMLSPEVNLQNLFMENVCVNKSFQTLLARVSMKKFRENFVITYGEVLRYWTIEGTDPRLLLLKRAHAVCKHHKKRHIDIALYFLELNKEFNKPVLTKILIDRLQNDKVIFSESFMEELTVAFEGPPAHRSRTIDIQLICEYIRRIWPDKKLPPTPPPEPEPESPPSPPPPVSKKKRGKRKK